MAQGTAQEKQQNPKTYTKSFEELTFELLDYKEELDRAIRQYEDGVRNMKRKDRIWTMVALGILILVGIMLVTSVGGIKVIIEYPEQVRPVLWACLGCLLLGFVGAHWLSRWERRADFNEEVMRRRREQAAEQYADLFEQLETLKAEKAAGKK